MGRIVAEIVQVEVVPTKYCKPFKLEIEIGTCRTRIAVIKEQFDKEGIRSLSKEQRKCHECDDAKEQELEIEGDDNLESGGDVMSNGLSLVNNTLSEQLKRLSNPDLKGKDLVQEIERTKALTEVSKQTINIGRLTLDAIKTVGPANMPGFLKLEDKGLD